MKYIILSGEGEIGTYSRHTGEDTLAAVKRAVNKERCGGDRWATAFEPAGPDYEDDTWVDIFTGEMRTIDADDIED